MFIFCDTWIQKVLADIKTGGATINLTTAKCDLYKNDFTPGRQTVLGDLDTADFTGYAQASVTPTGPFPDQVRGPYLRSALITFQVGATPTTTNTCFGYKLLDDDGVLIGAERFATPIPMIAPNTPLSFVVELRIRDY